MELPKEESVEWTNSKEGNMVFVQETKINNEKGEYIGTKEEIIKVKVTPNDLMAGITNVKGQMVKSKTDLENFEKDLKDLGKIPFQTAEMIKFKKMLDDIHKIEQAKEIARKIVPLRESLVNNQIFIDRRTALLEKRPKEE